MINNRNNWIDLASPFEDGCPQFELVTSLEYAQGYRKEIKEVNETFGLINGCFDILHTGHMWLLNRAALCCDHLWVAVNSDASVTELKPGRPVLRALDRVYSLLSLKAVRGAVLYNNTTCASVINKLKPDVMIKSEEYREQAESDIKRFKGYSDSYKSTFSERYVYEWEPSVHIPEEQLQENRSEHEHYTIAANDIDVVYIDKIPGHSTTSLINKIRLLEND